MRVLAIATAATVTAAAPSLPPVTGWPPYPHFPSRSCWTRPSPSGESGILRSAPSYVTHPARRAPSAIARSLLARLGDRRFVERIALGPPPPITRQHSGWFGKAKPPRDALWAYVADPVATRSFGNSPHPQAVQKTGIAEWEAELVFGALRDDICANGAAPLVGWSLHRATGVSDGGQALGQRFPNPTPAAFRTRVAAAGRRYGFTVVSLRLLQPLQVAPLLVVRTSRTPKSFVPDVAGIMQLLDPRTSAGTRSAVTFEGFYFEALNAADEPFVSVDDVYRGEVTGSQWSSNPCLYPYAHSTPFNQRC